MINILDDVIFFVCCTQSDLIEPYNIEKGENEGERMEGFTEGQAAGSLVHLLTL